MTTQCSTNNPGPKEKTNFSSTNDITETLGEKLNGNYGLESNTVSILIY